MRFFYFKRAVAKIDKVNAKASAEDDVRLALNEFSDWTEDEFRALLGSERFLESDSDDDHHEDRKERKKEGKKEKRGGDKRDDSSEKDGKKKKGGKVKGRKL